MMPRLAASILLAIVVLCAGIYLGGHPSGLPTAVRNPLVGDQDTRVVKEAIDEVHHTYYRELSRRQLADASIRGVVASLKDRFSNYFDPAQYAEFRQEQSGEFAGIGISVVKVHQGLRIVEVFDNSPAQRAAIRRGDLITEVDGRKLAGRSNGAAVGLIQGRSGTDVRLRITHRGRSRKVALTRATIEVPVVASHVQTVAGRRLEVVKLAEFSSGAHAEVARALRRGRRAGAQGIVLDLRNNPGGLVTEAQLVASQFLSDGTIVTTRGRAVPTRTLSAIGDPVAPRTPMVVLVNEDSASAAEIVAGALQDRHRARLVGTRTFGKGVFQEVIDLSNGGALDITAGQYFTPSGRNLGGPGTSRGSGLTPDVPARDDPKTARTDEALQIALRTLARRA